jgi:hypothetical protein
MHCCDDKNLCVFLKKIEHDRYMRKNDDFVLDTNDDMILKMDDALSWETKEFRKGYQNAIMQFQKKYNLRSKDAPAKPQQMNPIRKLLEDTPSTSRPRPDSTTKDMMEKDNSKEEAPKKTLEAHREAGGKEVEKFCLPFNFEQEMAKIKIFVLFNEIIRKG